MLSTYRLLLLALAAPLALVACGGGDDDDEIIIPEGTHHGYVVSKVAVVPEPPHQASDPGYGLDLGSKTSANLDGRIDNNLGFALTILSGLNEALNVQATLDTAINEGGVILLADVQTKDFVNSNAGFGLKFGASPNPAPCNSDMTMCGLHLKGGASFQVAANSPNNALLGGKLANGAFEGGPGQLTLQITIGSTTPILLPLVRSRARVTSVSQTGLKALIGGMITAADLKTHVGGALELSVAGLLAGACTELDPPQPPKCGCVDLADTLMMLLDGDNGTAKDCKISADEIIAFPATATFLSPDSCSMETCSAADAISVGLNIEAVAATFPQ
jgi:hypothetical protein